LKSFEIFENSEILLKKFYRYFDIFFFNLNFEIVEILKIFENLEILYEIFDIFEIS
jgi:hypothetical protein